MHDHPQRLAITITTVAIAAIALLGGDPATAQPRQAPAPSKPIAPPAPKVHDVEAGPLFDDAEAKARCPEVCKPPLTWNGRWRTTKPTVMSVCGCVEPSPPPAPQPPQATNIVREVEAGPLFNNTEANARCPKICVAPARWTGAWRTTKPGTMSVCSCEDPPPAPPARTVRTIATGAIRSNADAKRKCTKVCKAPLSWTGDWRTTKPGKASSCDCLEPAAPPPATTIAPPPTRK